MHAFAFFGAVPSIVVPDNLKSGVKRPDHYDPAINRTYADLAQHYAVIPAHVRKPRHKAKVEQGVLLKQEKTTKLGVKNKRLSGGWDNHYLLKVLGLTRAANHQTTEVKVA